MRVSLRLFASYRERVGASELAVDLPAGSTVGDLADEVLRQHPGLTPNAATLVVAVNQEYQDQRHPLNDGDEVALIPPVSGGSR